MNNETEFPKAAVPREPVILSQPDPEWEKTYEREKKALVQAIGKQLRQIDHIGSTSVRHLRAKAVVDILLAVWRLKSPAYYEPLLGPLGYFHAPEGDDEDRVFFRHSERQIHLHIVEMNSWTWKKHLIFRNALREDTHLRAEYEAVKGFLIKEHAGDRVSYNREKAVFINKVLDELKKKS